MDDTPALDPTPMPASDPANEAAVTQMQQAGAGLYKQAVARGNEMADRKIGMAPAAPTAQQAAPQFPTPPPAPPTSVQARVSANSEVSKPVRPKPAPEEPPKFEEPSVGGFLKALVQGSVPEVTSAPGQIAAGTGHGIALAAGAVAQTVDNLWDQIRGKEVGTTTGAETAVFDFDKDYIKPAIEHWTPKKGGFIGDDGSGAVAQGLGSGTQLLTYGRYGPAGITAFLTNAFTKSATDNIDEGMDVRDALVNAGLDAAGAAAQMLIIGKDALKSVVGKIVPTALIRRVLTAVPAGDLISMTTDLTKKLALEASGNHKAAEKIDVTQHLTNIEEAIQNAIYGAVTTHGAPKGAPKPGAPPPPPAAAVKPGTGEPPPPAEAAQPAPTPTGGATGTAHSPVPDQPTAEPAKQIRAQLVDMNRTNTPRQGVLISPDTQAHLDSVGGPEQSVHAAVVKNQIEQAKKQNRTVDTPAGLLITKTKDLAVKAKSQLKSGMDPQEVIGKFTGAGSGKDPAQTVVVQGREITDGSITSEKAVRPEDQGAATQSMLDQGKVPVVLTPDGVVAERHVGVTEEKQAAQEPAKPGEPAHSAEPVPAEIEAPEAPKEPVTEPTAPEKVREGIFKTDSGKEVPVHITGEVAGGKLTVRPLNEHGEPGLGYDVPAERVRTGNAPQEGTNAPQETQRAKPGTALDQLPAALALHEKQETAPAGRKNSASLKERQDNASAFAEVLHQSAHEAHTKGSATDADVERAGAAANAAKGLTNISKESTEKGRGTGHVRVTALNAEMHKAARALMGKAKPGDEVKVTPKEAATRNKVAKKTTAPKVPVEEESESDKRLRQMRENIAKAKREVDQEQEDLQDRHAGQAAVGTERAERQLKKAQAEQPKVAGEKDTQRFLALRDRFLNASDPEKATKARDELERHIIDVAERMGHENPREQAQEILRHLSEVREQTNKRPTGRLSDSLEDEEEKFDRPEEGFQTVYRPSIGGKAARMLWDKTTTLINLKMGRLAGKLHTSSFGAHMATLEDSGMPVSLHSVLDHMMQHADPGLVDMLRAVRERAPDVPVFSRSEIVSPTTGQALNSGVYGLFQASTRDIKPEHGGGAFPTPTIQIRFGDPRWVRTLIHEAWHAASEYELARNPHGQLAQELQQALEILRNRMRAKYTKDVIDQHLKFFDRRSGGDDAQPPGEIMWHLYGLGNVSEMLAELGSRPEFLQEIIDSEMFAQPGEGIPAVKGLPSLLAKIVSAISRMLGVKDPALAMHIIDTAMRTTEAQRVDPRNAEMYRPDAFNRITGALRPSTLKIMATEPQVRASIQELFADSPTVKAEGPVRAAVGDEAVETTRDSLHAFKSRSVDMARRTVMGLKTVGQIFRDGVSAFGHDDATNPLNALREVAAEKNKLIQSMRQISNPVARKWMALKNEDNRAVSQLMIDTTQYRIDPRLPADKQAPEAQERSGFDKRRAEYEQRYNNLSPEAREVYDGATDANKKLRQMERKSAIDAAVEGFDLKVSDGDRQLLYGARDLGAYDRMIGPGKLMDFGDKNEKVIDALKEWAGATDVQGPYHHLGRKGDWVVQATPEGTKEFGKDKAKAEEFAARAQEMSPNSKAKAEERGGQWVVDYKIDHVSMHESRAQAEKAQGVLRDAGFDVGKVTRKAFDARSAGALSSGMRELMTEATRKINKGGRGDKGTEALVDSLHSAFLQMQAQRSAYAGSRLTRKNVGGVKASDMRRNFAEHASSSIWHSSQIRTLFKHAAAMARLREMARDDEASQSALYRRGDVVSALNDHAAHEVETFGKKSPFNAAVARLGFMAYLASPAHAAIWLTQNITTGVPWTGARFGYGKATAAFVKGMAAVTGPAFRQTMHEVMSRGASSDEIHAAVVKAIKAHPTMGKWADAIQQLGDRGVISHGYSNELGAMARGENPKIARVFEWARLLPSMADAINRTSTALAGLELTGGDIRKTADMIETIHADYSQQNKPLAFKAVGRLPGMTSLTMFKTYAQEMIHLTYGNLMAAMKGLHPDGDRAGAWEGAKTVAGLMVSNTMFAGVYGAVALEPIRLMLYAYHKLFDEEGEVWDLKNAIHHFLVDHFGAVAGNSLARGPIAAALGVDVQDRMGLANLFFHNPPDLLSPDKEMWKTFIYDEAGPGIQLLANTATTAAGHIQNGEYGAALATAVPVKMWQDGVKALQFMNTGAQNRSGAAMTQPSALDAGKQLFGLKPAAVADAQEKAGVKAEYSRVQGATKGSIIKEWLSHPEGSPEREEARARLRAFNERNRGAGITGRDIKREAVKNAKEERGVPTKNQRAEKAATF